MSERIEAIAGVTLMVVCLYGSGALETKLHQRRDVKVSVAGSIDDAKGLFNCDATNAQGVYMLYGNGKEVLNIATDYDSAHCGLNFAFTDKDGDGHVDMIQGLLRIGEYRRSSKLERALLPIYSLSEQQLFGRADKELQKFRDQTEGRK